MELDVLYRRISRFNLHHDPNHLHHDPNLSGGLSSRSLDLSYEPGPPVVKKNNRSDKDKDYFDKMVLPSDEGRTVITNIQAVERTDV